LTGRAARDHDRELADEADPLLEQDRPAAVEPGCDLVLDLLSRADLPHSLAVVSAAGCLGDDRPADPVTELRDVGGRGRSRPGRARDAELTQPGAHRELVLRILQGGWAGVYRDPELGHRRQDVVRDVLVVEGDDVTVPGE